MLGAWPLAGALAAIPANARPAGTPFLSPPLTILGQRRLALTIPPAWTIVDRDTPSQWSTRSYGLHLRWSGPVAPTRPAAHGVYLEVLMHDLVWAEMHGDLSGTRFQAASGLRGVEHGVQYRPGEREWYLTIPVKATQGALTVRLGGLTGGRREQWRMVRPLFRSVRFVPGTGSRRIGDARRTLCFTCRTADPPTSVPTLARLAGFRVGVDTIEAMEQRLGHGQVLMGGHPNGARSWWLWGGRWHLWGDGFDYHDRGGRVIDGLSLDEQSLHGPGAAPRSERRPPARVPRRSLGWMGVVFPGMTRQQVLWAVAGKLPPPRVKVDVWRWTAKGFVRVNTINHEKFTVWNAEMGFEQGRVSYVSVECE